MLVQPGPPRSTRWFGQRGSWNEGTMPLGQPNSASCLTNLLATSFCRWARIRCVPRTLPAPRAHRTVRLLPPAAPGRPHHPDFDAPLRRERTAPNTLALFSPRRKEGGAIPQNGSSSFGVISRRAECARYTSGAAARHPAPAMIKLRKARSRAGLSARHRAFVPSSHCPNSRVKRGGQRASKLQNATEARTRCVPRAIRPPRANSE
jgi:hypothetical protein